MSLGGAILLATFVALVAFFVGLVVGVAVERKPAPPDPDKLCPWGCGWPMPATGMLFWENSEKGGTVTKSSREKCDGCDRWICWAFDQRRFVRTTPGIEPRPDPGPPKEEVRA